VELEGDTLQMVQALRKEGCNLSKYGHIIEEARGVLNGFCQLKVAHIRRIACKWECSQSCDGSTHF